VGKADGPVVFYFHGHRSSRLEALVIAEQAVAFGVRLIALDRPGIGRSSANEGYRLVDWPDDVIEVADQLRIGRFAVVGHSAGGAYALACAYKYPHRLTACGLISTLPPAALISRAAPPGIRVTWWIIQCLPTLLRLYLALLPDQAVDEGKVEKQLLRFSSHLAAADRALLRIPELRKHLAQAMVESGRQGPRGNRYEAIMLAGPWGFQPSETAFEKIFLWHGERDRLMPVAAARLLAQELPHCTAVFYPGEGHLSVFKNRTREIHNALQS
jgi:pimeloyl-ACP methyl ester carboxylesterase